MPARSGVRFGSGASSRSGARFGSSASFRSGVSVGVLVLAGSIAGPAAGVELPEPPPLPTPSLSVGCTKADTTRGVVVAWEVRPSWATVVAVERADDEGVEVIHRPTGSGDGEWIDAELDDDETDQPPDEAEDAGDPEDPADGEAVAREAGTTDYRVVVVADDGEQVTVPCDWTRGNIGRFQCSVTFTRPEGRADPGHLIEWFGGPTGPGSDYVVERRVLRHVDGGRFDVRGTTEERAFTDTVAERVPSYRVTARFDGADALTVECEPDRVLAHRVFDADFVCPVPGSTFVDTFGADRDGGARTHKGVDMFAAAGTPVVAPESGDLVQFWNDLGGRSFGLYGDSGTFYYGAHLDSYVGDGGRVVAGELIGTVGKTGNARTTPPHLHFEIHPGGRHTPAVNPTAATVRACGLESR